MKKLEGGIWESKFILPEYRSGIEHDLRESQRRKKPLLDEQQLEEIDKALYYSQLDKVPVTLKLWDPFDDRTAKGIVLQFDRQLRRIKLQWSEDDWDWVDMDEILSATT
ncbi:hypothetical protein J2Z22_001566 [Paenibacillus forsythiae]|uniref:YolD-like family protein n=1 Tax=Paenibacillus forsythiae TaxID=365616 RepID=A0ABU3H6G9_9BACL|nr:YolD-like family protein [Paenibacillus forsythiae]MDT3426046.1 hypothetical protein [Paenibacillus forsythiae]